ncbi:SDR family oxidoreductase [Duganella sp. FT134W]|uniref:SDR family oxidoreductase n=1 Tax=Duganella margarita TaxID=2692170 RepID=A0A7X4GYZ5_9BURK|nr:SDR family oxidoreductase [Duganella margarita]MYM72282.1 SDR family oxidoreductase [Duganella margarita]
MNTATNNREETFTPSLSLSGKKVVVVGGKTGIGLGIARAAHAAGASVVVVSRRVASAQERPDLSDFEQVSLDIRQEAAVQAAFEAIGAFDHLIVTAAPDIGTWGGFMDADMQGVRSYVEGKFLGTWACARYAAPHLRASGSITFLTGGMAVRPKLGFTAVTASFAAVEALSSSLALELAPLRVNTIRPGYIDTDMWGFLPEAQRDGMRNKVAQTFPVQRAGRAADVGHAAVFLMTNPYVTGTVVEVSGGENLVPAI